MTDRLKKKKTKKTTLMRQIMWKVVTGQDLTPAEAKLMKFKGRSK